MNKHSQATHNNGKDETIPSGNASTRTGFVDCYALMLTKPKTYNHKIATNQMNK